MQAEANSVHPTLETKLVPGGTSTTESSTWDIRMIIELIQCEIPGKNPLGEGDKVEEKVRDEVERKFARTVIRTCG
jgi:hypothetical protein